MESGPKDFMPGFESYGEFRSALKDAKEAKRIAKKRIEAEPKEVKMPSEDDTEEEDY